MLPPRRASREFLVGSRGVPGPVIQTLARLAAASERSGSVLGRRAARPARKARSLAARPGPMLQMTAFRPAYGPALAAGLLAACLACSPSAEDRRDSGRAVASLDLYPGLEATLFAAEPALSNPTNIDIDHRGRVWACDVVNYREHARNDERPEGDRILILEDTDADGAADSSKVYYQGRDVDAALGIAVLGNQVIVTAAPNVLVFTDEDGDDRPDRKEYLFVNSGAPQNDHSTHSLSFGPDGSFYWNMGNAGRYVHDRDGRLARDGTGHPVLDRNFARAVRDNPDGDWPEFALKLAGLASPYQGGMAFRCDFDGTGMEVLGHNFRNNYEVAVDSLGGVWQSDNDDDGSYACRINYLLEHGNYGYRDQMTGASNQAERTGQHEEIPHRHWHQNDPGVVPNLLITGAGSPTGVTSYEGRLLPREFWDQILATDAGPGVLRGILAEKRGAGYSASMVDLLKAERDKWVRPVDVAVAPDGSVFVSDWYDPVIGWNRQEDTGRGRIFRIAPAGHSYRPPRHEFETAEGAVEALKSPNYAVRYLAWTFLDDARREAEALLARLFREGAEVRHRARALWLLARLPERGPDYVREALADGDEDIRIVGLRATRRRGMNLLPVIEALASDPSPHVRRECAIALRDLSSPRAAELWAKLANQHVAGDRWSLEALGIGADGNWDACLAKWLATAGADWSSASGRDVIWRSRGSVTPAYLSRILRSTDMRGNEAAAARYLRAFDFQPQSLAKERVLRRLALAPPADGRPKDFFVAAEALLRLPKLDLESDPSARRSVEDLLARGEATAQFARLVSRYELAAHYPSLIEAAARNMDSSVGMASIRTLLEADMGPAILEFVRSEPELAAGVVKAVGNARTEESVPLLRSVLLDVGLPPPVRDRAARSLAGFSQGAEALVALARRGEFPPDIAEVAGASLTRSMHVRLRDEAAKYFPIPPMRNREPLPQMTELLVYVGDTENGAEVFESATCGDCHVVNGSGTNFGPELSKIGNKLPKAGIYESILDPSAGVSPTFDLTLLSVRGRDEVSGFVIDETGDSVTLRMEGGVVADFAKAEILERRLSAVSAMPDDLQEQMSVDELIDLVEYLSRLR